MSSYPELDSVRIGCVKYLNAAPLIYNCGVPVHFDHPSALAVALSNGDLDVALVSVSALFSHPSYRVVDGVSISSRGPVTSVFLAYQGDLAAIKTVVLDPASLTSSHLIRCLLAEYHNITPAYVASSTVEPAARLLIGNQALDFRAKHGAEYNYLDLGEEWSLRTSLPFVYALWLIHPQAPNPGLIANALRRMKAEGIAHIREIAETQPARDPAFCLHYLTECIRYDFGDPERAGLRTFNTLLHKYKFVSSPEICYQIV